ncbi:17022_t:CDS:2, partial [Acaulospora morrowiae]
MGVHVAELAIRCEGHNHPVSEYNIYRKLFVEDILSVILRNKIIVHEKFDIKVYNPQDYLSVPYEISSIQDKYPTNINVIYSQLRSWLEKAQG